MAVKNVPESPPEQVAAAVAARPATAEEAIKRVQAEYGNWVAAQPIYFGTALGYNRGDPVGEDVVQRHSLSQGDDPLVVKVGSAAHKRIREEQGLPPLES